MSTAIRTAILGFGTSGRVFHAPFIAADPEFELGAVVTSDADRAAQVRAEYPGTEVIASAEELLSRADEFDLVTIGTPPATHADLAVAALDAGLHVIVDKPFTVTTVEGQRVLAVAERSGRRLTVFQNRRRDGDFRTLEALVREGRLDPVTRFESRFETFNPTPRVSWKRSAGIEQGGGVLYDLGAHLIDQALRLFGPVDPETVPYVESDSRIPGAAAPDDAFVALRHVSGTWSHLWMNTLAAQKGPRFRVLTPSAAYTSWGLDPQEGQLKSGMRPGQEGFGAYAPDAYGRLGTDAESEAVPTQTGDYAGYYREVADWILRGEGVPVDPSDSLAVIALIQRLHALAAL